MRDMLTPDCCYVCGAALTPEATRIAQIDGGGTIIRICGNDDCANDERIDKLIGSAADYERWLHERWMVEHGGPDFDLAMTDDTSRSLASEAEADEGKECEICGGSGRYIQAIVYEDAGGNMREDTSNILCHGCNGTGYTPAVAEPTSEA